MLLRARLLAPRQRILALPYRACSSKAKKGLESVGAFDMLADKHQRPSVIKPIDSPSGVNMKDIGGVPDFIEHWGPQPFRRLGYGLVAASLGSWYLAHLSELNHIMPALLSTITAGYWYLGLKDLGQKHQALRSNFPVLIHIRYLLESIRPEIQQYLVEPDDVALPFSREMRTVIYQRAKGLPDTRALGTKHDVYAEGYEWAAHSMFPKHVDEATGGRVTIGGPDCSQPYSASILNISAMSYGALSGPAVSALNLGAQRGGFYHNTGEGGISKFHKMGGDVVWNIGTGYFACGETLPGGKRRFDPTLFEKNAKLDCVKMIEIKLSQGAKPAHGGVLPASKITEEIAEARDLGDGPHTDCNSPPHHSAFKSPWQLMRFIAVLRELSGGKPIGFKLCVGQPHEFAALCHAMLETGTTPDFITVDGAEGGTGAAPLEFQNSIGFPLAEGLTIVDSLLTGAGLRDRVKLIASGKVHSGFSLVKTLSLGADVTNAARAFMFSLGCIQALKCNSNTCPTGITTQDPALSSGLDVASKSERVSNFHAATVHSALEIVGALGLESPTEIKRSHVYRRTSGITAKDFNRQHSEFFPLIYKWQSGILLDDIDAVPEYMRRQWLKGKELHERMRNQEVVAMPGGVPADAPMSAYDKQALETFRKYDTDNSGDIDATELRSALDDMGASRDVNVAALLKKYDSDTNHSFDVVEFTKILKQVQVSGGAGFVGAA